LVFGRLPEQTPALWWLALAAADCVCMLPGAPATANALAAQIRRLPVIQSEQRTSRDRASVEMARLCVAAGCVVLFQAILRRPVVAVLGSSAEPFIVEATVGMLALLILIAVLAWIYSVSRPLLESMAAVALDVALATSAAEKATDVATRPAGDPTTLHAGGPSARDAVTVAASAAPTVRSARWDAREAVTEVAEKVRVDSRSDSTQGHD
jgi:hypothetical protein